MQLKSQNSVTNVTKLKNIYIKRYLIVFSNDHLHLERKKDSTPPY